MEEDVNYETDKGMSDFAKRKHIKKSRGLVKLIEENSMIRNVEPTGALNPLNLYIKREKEKPAT